MDSQPHSHEFRNNPENFHPCLQQRSYIPCRLMTAVYKSWEYITGLDKKSFERKIVNICSSISFNICCGCSKEQSH